MQLLSHIGQAGFSPRVSEIGLFCTEFADTGLHGIPSQAVIATPAPRFWQYAWYQTLKNALVRTAT